MPYPYQKGAVLIVSLVLLMVMTLLGITAIDSSQLQSQMARNSQLSQHLHQVAFSEIQTQIKALEDPEYLNKITTSLKAIEVSQYQGLSKNGVGVALTGTSATTHNTGERYTQSGAIAYIGNVASPSGYSLNLYTGKNYEIYMAVQSAGTTSISEQTQGLNRITPNTN